MKIKFSRHAKRRAQLYDIPESVIEKILITSKLNDGTNTIIKNAVNFKYPIKLVVSVKNNIATIITNYPLKKGINHENSL